MIDEIEGKYEMYINQIPNNIDILITHQPPKNILDYSQKIHYGSIMLLKRIEQIRPKFHLFGHIHDNYGTQKQGETIFMNTALMNENYKIVNAPRKFIIKSSSKKHINYL